MDFLSLVWFMFVFKKKTKLFFKTLIKIIKKNSVDHSNKKNQINFKEYF